MHRNGSSDPTSRSGLCRFSDAAVARKSGGSRLEQTMVRGECVRAWPRARGAMNEILGPASLEVEDVGACWVRLGALWRWCRDQRSRAAHPSSLLSLEWRRSSVNDTPGLNGRRERGANDMLLEVPTQRSNALRISCTSMRNTDVCPSLCGTTHRLASWTVATQPYTSQRRVVLRGRGRAGVERLGRSVSLVGRSALDSA